MCMGDGAGKLSLFSTAVACSASMCLGAYLGKVHSANLTAIAMVVILGKQS
jgi:hypothetical protein